MVAGGAVDQLGGDPNPVASFADAAFQHVGDAERLRDFLHVDRLALEREGRVARHHRQRGHLRQIGDDVLADSVAEILLLGLAAHVDERKHAYRGAFLAVSFSDFAASRDRPACPKSLRSPRAGRRARLASGCRPTRLARSSGTGESPAAAWPTTARPGPAARNRVPPRPRPGPMRNRSRSATTGRRPPRHPSEPCRFPWRSASRRGGAGPTTHRAPHRRSSPASCFAASTSSRA